LPDYIGEANGFSGCTILGDGTVSLIVDVGAVSQMTGSFHASPVNKASAWSDEPALTTSSSYTDVSFADLEAQVV
jgi:chemotaxis protein histidine kinase CheA